MSRIGGGLIMVLAVVFTVVLLWGIALGSYWAVAIPVAVGFLGVMALAFWIGWTMAVTETEFPETQIEEERPADDAEGPRPS